MNIHEISKQELARLVWILRPAVEEHPDGSMPMLVKDAFENEACFWAVSDGEKLIGSMVTRLIEFETGYTVLCVVAAASDRSSVVTKQQMRDLAKGLEKVAFDMGLDGIRICGRAGWGRILDGYVEVDRTFDKRFDRSSV